MGKRIRVLQLLGGGNAIGGVEKMLLNYYSYMDRGKVQFDFCFYRESTFHLVKEEYKDVLESASIYELKLFDGKSSLSGYMKAIPRVIRIIKANNYDIVHINSGRSALLITGLIASILSGVKIRIAHSHSTKGKNNSSVLNIFSNIASSMIACFLCSFSTNLFACSTEAGIYMFGKKAVHFDKYSLIRNAINVEPYLFQEEKRLKIRKENNILDDTLIFGHVGRFSEEKNHLFMLDTFEKIHCKNSNTVLWLVGDGNLKEEVESKIKEKGLGTSIRLLGERQDVQDLIHAMDAMIFPSIYEGLSVTLVEAQAASLPVFASDSISLEHKITDIFCYLPLDKGTNYWAEYISSNINNLPLRKNRSQDIKTCGYDIRIEAKRLEELYLRVVRNS